MTKRLKILQLQPKCDVRATDLQEEIVKSLSADEFEVTNAYFHGSPEKTGIYTESEKAHYFHFSANQRKGLRIRLMWKVWKFCQKEKFDVVITHRFKPMDVILKLNRFLRIPHCIAVIHGFGDFDRSYRRRTLHKNNSPEWRYVAVSPPVAEYLSKMNDGLIKNQVISINNALNTDSVISTMLSKEKARLKLKLSKSSFVFGTIGRLVGVKGHINLLKAFHLLYEKDQSIKLVIIGEGKERPVLERYIQENQLDNAVVLPGEIINANTLLKAFDVLVLPSLSEGLPIVILEAMAGKIPAIASRVGGVPEALGNEGTLIPAAEVSPLFEAMQKYHNLTNKQREEIGGALHQRLLEHFDIKQYREKYRNLITTGSI